LRVVALVASYNEARFIGGCLAHLREQGIEAYLCDNDSTDDTVAIARTFLGSGLRGIERIPRDGTFRWHKILQRKEELALELDADWFLHVDPDEVHLPPRGYTTLLAAIAAADQEGCNAFELDELTFVPTREEPDHDHPEFRRTMRWYYPFASGPNHLVRGWKARAERVDLATSGGHNVTFADRRIWPRRFRLCHYLFLSRDHASRKYIGKSFDPEELAVRRWHSWRPTLTQDAIRLPSMAQLRTTVSEEDLDPSSPHARHCLQWPAL
jgi:hypothetical protein